MYDLKKELFHHALLIFTLKEAYKISEIKRLKCGLIGKVLHLDLLKNLPFYAVLYLQMLAFSLRHMKIQSSNKMK